MFEMNEALLKYVPASKREGIRSIFHDSDGYWIYLHDGWNADRMDSDIRTIHEDTIKDLRYQIGGIRKL